jgi:hypothetical protein
MGRQPGELNPERSIKEKCLLALAIKELGKRDWLHKVHLQQCCSPIQITPKLLGLGAKQPNPLTCCEDLTIELNLH